MYLYFTFYFFVKHFKPAFDSGVKCDINQLYYYYCDGPILLNTTWDRQHGTEMLKTKPHFLLSIFVPDKRRGQRARIECLADVGTVGC